MTRFQVDDDSFLKIIEKGRALNRMGPIERKSKTGALLGASIITWTDPDSLDDKTMIQMYAIQHTANVGEA